MNLLISGTRGLLGSAIADAAHAAGHQWRALDRALVDPRDPAALAALLGNADCLVHAAANTNVEQCERDPQACYRDNTLLTELLARAAAGRGIRMVFVSSTGVYGDGQAAPWHEYDACVPTTHHHRSKLLAEQAVQRYLPDALIVRTGWLFGGRPDNARNFVMRRVDEARAAAGAAIRSNSQQRGNPSWVRDVAARLLELLALRQAGVFNCVGSGSASRFDYVSAIVALAGLPNAVEPVAAGAFGRLAAVPDNESAGNWRAATLGLAPMPDWRTSLRHYLHDELGLPEA
jgi:dTDP-4-dehydrorhamnose reductase